jgi:hypothetical protein
MTMSADAAADSTKLDQRRLAGANRLRFSFGLRTLLLCFTVFALIAGYLAWNVSIVEQRRMLLIQCQENDVFAIGNSEDAFGTSGGGIKDFRKLTILQLFRGWEERTTDPPISFIRDAPLHRGKLPWVRQWLGDRRVSQLFLTDPTAFARYRSAFPEAMIVVDPGADGRISAWERHTGTLRSQLTRSP